MGATVDTYRSLEHLGEVELELEAASEAGVFESAAAAFAELVTTSERGEPARHVIERRATAPCCSSTGSASSSLAYKDVERAVEVVERAGVARRVVRLVPIGVVKG